MTLIICLKSQGKFSLFFFFPPVSFPESVVSIDVEISLKPIGKYLSTHLKKMLALTHIFNMMANICACPMHIPVFLLQNLDLEEFWTDYVDSHCSVHLFGVT